ncbi:hypothetical protein [Rhizobium sp. PP-CC-3G-465]|uniref:hypothetical protein n=1 Tax=Rhizobium sp. PP-CC-3G-465 TaxID=2135648 RepID=UPI00104DDCF4|nr:hypothetical protein C8J33_101870 [Rhizobium sp. PP-CC-3G-465]
MISVLIDAHRASVLDDEANFDAAGNPLDALAVRASEAAEQRAFIALATAQCTNGEEVEDKVHYFATGTVGERSTLAAYLLEHSDGDFVLLQQFVASLSLQNGKGSATAPTVPSHGSTIPAKESNMNTMTDTTAPAEKKASDRDVAKAMRSLEDLIHDTRMTAVILDDMLEYEFNSAKSTISSRIEFTADQRDNLFFLSNQVRGLTFSLKEAFEAAWHGEERA